MKSVILKFAFICIALMVYGSLLAMPGKQSAKSDNPADENEKITGVWRAVSSSGGFTGKGFTLDFDLLMITMNGEFAVMQHDSMIGHGKIILSKDKQMVLCKFVFNKTNHLQLAIDPEKYIQVTHTDTLNLIAPCCDRYNIKLARSK